LDRHVLLVDCEEISPLSGELEAGMVFVGGFDAPSVMTDPSASPTCLCLSYPTANRDELLALSGTIDLPEKPEAARV